MSVAWYDMTIARGAVMKRDWRGQDYFIEVGEKVELIAESEESYKIRPKSDLQRIFIVPKEFIYSLGTCIKPPSVTHVATMLSSDSLPLSPPIGSSMEETSLESTIHKIASPVSIRQQNFHKKAVSPKLQAAAASLAQRLNIVDRKQGFSSRSNVTLVTSLESSPSDQSKPDLKVIRDEYGFNVRLSQIDLTDSDAIFKKITRQRHKFTKLFIRLGNESGTCSDIAFRNISMWSKWSSTSSDMSSSSSGINLSLFASRTLRLISNAPLPAAEADPRLPKKITKAIRRGIPSELRGEIWYQCCNCTSSSSSSHCPDEGNGAGYNDLLDLVKTYQTIPCHVDIEKDLYRTFPTNSNFESEEGIVAMRSVLSAYSLRNPLVGYCQSMNFLCALLLLHESEVRSFSMLSILIEHLLPACFYDKALSGSRAEQLSFMSVIQWKLPKLHAHFQLHHIPIEPLTISWFMCAFINTLRFDHVLRVWDCLLHLGSVALIRIGLVLMKINEFDILATDDFMTIAKIIKNPMRVPGLNHDDDNDGGGVDVMAQTGGIRASIDDVIELSWDEKFFGNCVVFDDYVRQLRSAHLTQINAEVCRIKSMRESFHAASSSSSYLPTTSTSPNQQSKMAQNSPVFIHHLDEEDEEDEQDHHTTSSSSVVSPQARQPFERAKPPRPAIHPRATAMNRSHSPSISSSSSRSISSDSGDDIDERLLWNPRITLRNVKPIQLAPVESTAATQDDDEEEDDEDSLVEPVVVQTEAAQNIYRRGSLMAMMKL